MEGVAGGALPALPSLTGSVGTGSKAAAVQVDSSVGITTSKVDVLPLAKNKPRPLLLLQRPTEEEAMD